MTANCFHPGYVASGLGTNNGLLAKVAVFLGTPFALTPAKGADTLIYLATSPDVASVSGKYFSRRREASLSNTAKDDVIAAKLWAESERIAGGA